jgi:hypothetical protein
MSLWLITGTSCNAARTLDAGALLVTAAFTCISRTLQYPRGSAHAGTGWCAALVTADLARLNATVRRCESPPLSATLTAWRAPSRLLPGPFRQARYCWPQPPGAAAAEAAV